MADAFAWAAASCMIAVNWRLAAGGLLEAAVVAGMFSA